MTVRGKPRAWMRKHLARNSFGNECIEWPFAKIPTGHGVYNKMGAHRYVLIHFEGKPVGPRNHCAHGCGNASCVNPRHLRWATPKENMEDMKLHGTWPEGEKAGRAKLTKDEVIDIFLDDRTHDAIATEYNITASNVSCIKRGKSWVKYTCHLALDPSTSTHAVRKRRKDAFKARQLARWRPEQIKYEVSNPGCSRNDCIRHLRAKGATLQVIGDLYHLSRERIRQVLTLETNE